LRGNPPVANVARVCNEMRATFATGGLPRKKNIL